MHLGETEFGPSHPLPFSSRKLSHPKLVQLYGVCLEQAPICLVFEFMEHGCLSDYLRNQRGLFAAETLLGMCLDVCEGMAYLEEACVIHRDLVGRRVRDSHLQVQDAGATEMWSYQDWECISQDLVTVHLPLPPSFFLPSRTLGCPSGKVFKEDSDHSPASNFFSLSLSLHFP